MPTKQIALQFNMGTDEDPLETLVTEYNEWTIRACRFSFGWLACGFETDTDDSGMCFAIGCGCPRALWHEAMQQVLDAITPIATSRRLGSVLDLAIGDGFTLLLNSVLGPYAAADIAATQKMGEDEIKYTDEAVEAIKACTCIREVRRIGDIVGFWQNDVCEREFHLRNYTRETAMETIASFLLV